MVLNGTGRWSALGCVPTLERGNDVKLAELRQAIALAARLIHNKNLSSTFSGMTI